MQNIIIFQIDYGCAFHIFWKQFLQFKHLKYVIKDSIFQQEILYRQMKSTTLEWMVQFYNFITILK